MARTADHIYIFEFKLHGSAEEAMQQIHDKQYAAPYRDAAGKRAGRLVAGPLRLAEEVLPVIKALLRLYYLL